MRSLVYYHVIGAKTKTPATIKQPAFLKRLTLVMLIPIYLLIITNVRG